MEDLPEGCEELGAGPTVPAQMFITNSLELRPDQALGKSLEVKILTKTSVWQHRNL